MLRQLSRSAITDRGALISTAPLLSHYSNTSTFTSSVSRIHSFQQSSLQISPPSHTRIAAFHASSRRTILPALPQRIVGTINEAAKVPDPSPSHGSYHWTFERLLSAALVPLTIAPFAAGSLNPVMDATLCFAILIHSHIGFESIIIDYIPTRRLPKTRLLFWWGLRTGTVLVGVGLYEFETNDVGITEAIKKIWTA